MRKNLIILALALFLTSVIGFHSLDGTLENAFAEKIQETIPTISIDSIVASGFNYPVGIYNAGDGSNRLFVVEQNGKIRILKAGQVLAVPFLDVSSLLPCTPGNQCGERGLLGLAFHPNFATNGIFFINFTRKSDGATVITRYKRSSNPDIADPASAENILVIGQPYANHNGGHLMFGSDGYLYVGMGDGGSGGDPLNNALNMNNLLGKMLRLQVSTSDPAGYTIPPGNMQVGGVPSEIWALGLRNPWHFSFDRLTNDLYIGDVGQNAWEEINFRGFLNPAGSNYGWSCLEGTHPYNLNRVPCNDPAYVSNTIQPIAEYSHAEGQSVTGGYVYRGDRYPSLFGRYFYADFGSGIIWSLTQTSSQPLTFSTPVKHLDSNLSVSCFGEDEAGEMYLCNYGAGTIHQLRDALGSPPNFTGTWLNSEPVYADQNETVDFTLHLINRGGSSKNPVTVQITVPNGLLYQVGSLNASSGSTNQTGNPILTWSGILTPNVPVDIHYAISVGVPQGNPITQASISGVGYPILNVKHALLVPRPLLQSTRNDFFFPGTQPNSLVDPILLPVACDVCHTAQIVEPWQGSMMSQSGRDPLFWAAVEVANHDAPGSGEYCLRCHTPRGWLAGRSSDPTGALLGEGDIETGVGCNACHRAVASIGSPQDQSTSRDNTIRSGINPALPGSHAGSAMLIFDPSDYRRGPFDLGVNFTYHPNQTFRTNFLGGTPLEFIARSSLCGACHNVDNPVYSCSSNLSVPCQINANDTPAPSFEQDALFPVESTFEEWLNSSFVTVAACQDCHMPRSTGYAAESFFNPVWRDCGVNGCLPLHEFVGGNSWIPILLQDPRWRLSPPGITALLDKTVNSARSMLMKAAEVSVTPLSPSVQDPGRLQASVIITNLAGHKLPTGYAEGRRMWLSVKAYDQNGNEVFSSCQYDLSTGVLTPINGCQIFEVQQGISSDVAAALGKPAGAGFHFVLNNYTVKDSRIPPAGFSNNWLSRRSLAPVPENLFPLDSNPSDLQYSFTITFSNIDPSAVSITAFLYYQTTSSEYIDFLRQSGGVDSQTLYELWTDLKSPPELVAWDSYPIYSIFKPLISR